MLTGIPFAGKSSLAKAIQDQLNAVIIAIDDIHAERGLLKTDKPLSQADWESSFELAYHRVRQALRQHRYVVFDAVNGSKKRRAARLLLAQTENASAILIYAQASTEQSLQRYRANLNTAERFRGHQADYRRVVERYQPPTSDEQALTFTSDTDNATQWVANHLVKPGLAKRA